MTSNLCETNINTKHMSESTCEGVAETYNGLYENHTQKLTYKHTVVKGEVVKKYSVCV